MSGQISGQVPNQAGTQLPVLPQQNGNALPQMQNLGGPPRTPVGMDPEVLRARTFMHDKIYEILLHRLLRHQQHQQPFTESQNRNFMGIVKRHEECLFRTAHTQEEYTNLDTLETRLLNLIRPPPLNSQNQQYPQILNNTSSIGAMIPTPGMSHGGNSNMMVTSSMDTSMIPRSGGNSIAPNNVNAGNVLPTGGLPGGSFNRSDVVDEITGDILSLDINEPSGSTQSFHNPTPTP